jgi:hypothetical protein
LGFSDSIFLKKKSMKKTWSKKKANKRSESSNNSLLKVVGPPPIIVNQRQKKFRMRFDVLTNQPAAIITFGDIASLLALKSGVATETGIIFLWESVRLLEVHLWGPAVSNTTMNTLGIEFSANYASGTGVSLTQSFVEGVNTTRTNDSSTSNTGSSHIVKYPSGLAAAWINAASIMVPTTQVYNAAGDQNMFTVTAPAHSVMDLVVQCVVSDGTFPVIYSSTQVTALPPGTYGAGLAFAGGSSQIQPQDYNVYD